MSSSKFSGSSKVLEELQGFAAFVAYDNCYKMGKSMTSDAFENMMEGWYFGNPADDDSIGLAEQLVSGLMLFAGLYNEELLQDCEASSDHTRGYGGVGLGDKSARSLNRVTNPSLSTIPGSVLVMKPELHCLGEHKKFVVSETGGLNLSTMLASGWGDKSSDAITGRTLHNRSKEILKNCKKALTFLHHRDSPYKNWTSDGCLPSWMYREDYLLYVRKKMYVALLPAPCTNKTMPTDSSATVPAASVADATNPHSTSTASVAATVANTNENAIMTASMAPVANNSLMTSGRASVATVVESSASCGKTKNDNHVMAKDDDVIQPTMPDDYMFPGYLVFAMMGPIVPQEVRKYQSHLIMEKPETGDGTIQKPESKRKRGRRSYH